MYQFPIFSTQVHIKYNEARDGFTYAVNGVPTTVALPHDARSSLHIPSLSVSTTSSEEIRNMEVCLHRLENRFNSFDTIHHYAQASEIQASVKSLIYEELKNLDTALRRKSTQFQTQLDRTIDNVLQDVCTVADERHTAMTKAAATIMENIKQSTTVINDFLPNISELKQISAQLLEYKQLLDQSKSKPQGDDAKSVWSQPPLPGRWTNWAKGPLMSTRWSNTHTDTANTTQFTQPHDTSRMHPQATSAASSNPLHDQQPTSNKNFCSSGTHHQNHNSIPHTVHLPPQSGTSKEYPSMDQYELPPVNHDAAIKCAKIQYTSLGDLFVFYNQLLNSMEQFGVYLSPLDTVRYQESVCPAAYNHQPITPRHYRTMASTLYQKLQNPEVVPLEHTAIRNIINRYAEQNDGYKVLYAMLELVHPALHQDAVLLPPKSTECNEDVHLYAQKFDSWLKYEAFANMPYSARETVNLFLRELSPHFAPAISRVRRLMDTWNQYDPSVPEPLRITSLPVTIERFLNEETNTTTTPWIRRMHSNPSPRKGGRPTHVPDDKSRDKDTRQAKDRTCRLCGGYGHEDAHCDFMAKWINAQDALKTVDAKLKERLKDTYKQEQQRRRNRKLCKKVGVIRQMLDDGVHPDDVDEALAALPHLLDSQDDVSDTDSEPSGDAQEQAVA
jgi:hypothetical protein